ncbi:MAG: hypothetical protein GQ548_02540 [Methylophaga sp.]|nr:hypothetical protein [Methylophaga sp.]
MTIEIKWSVGDFSGGMNPKTKITLGQAKDHYDSAIKSLQKSTTAKSIIDFVTGHNTLVYLVCVPGGEGEFLFPGEMDEIQTPTIIWDPNKDFVFYSNVSKTSNIFFADKSAYQPAIVLLHEMGHCKQWLENEPHGYEALVHSGDAGVSKIEADNLERHESPVAKQLGLPVRSHYKHFPGSGVEGALEVKETYAGVVKKGV